MAYFWRVGVYRADRIDNANRSRLGCCHKIYKLRINLINNRLNNITKIENSDKLPHVIDVYQTTPKHSLCILSEPQLAYGGNKIDFLLKCT